MHYLVKSIFPVSAAVLFASAHASYLNSDLSFGHNDRISLNGRSVPNFFLMGSPNPPQILSNKVVLTPPTPGNERGAIWAEKPLQYKYWTLDVDFRATGPERAGGNFQIWYVKDGQRTVGTSSIYTVGKFDGLVLSIDQYAGTAGFIRGFLNDGTTDYKSHHSVDSLSFGHCEYAYRNLGRPSRIAISQTDTGFQVLVDGQNCFTSSRVNLPTGNTPGITAASADTPDSFEVFKMVTTTDSHAPDGENGSKQRQTGQAEASSDSSVKSDEREVNSPDKPVSAYRTTDEQFADLHFRLQAMAKHINGLNQMVVTHQSEYMKRQEELFARLQGIETTINHVNRLTEHLIEVQKDISRMKGELHDALDQHMHGVKESLHKTHREVQNTHYRVHHTHEKLKGYTAGAGNLAKMGMLVLGSQAVVVLAFILYKRRKARAPKKYL